MWKIKQEDLDKLFNYDFKFFGDSYRKKVYLGNDNDDRTFYVVDLNGNFQLKRLDGELDNTIYYLVKDGILYWEDK